MYKALLSHTVVVHIFNVVLPFFAVAIQSLFDVEETNEETDEETDETGIL